MWACWDVEEPPRSVETQIDQELSGGVGGPSTKPG